MPSLSKILLPVDFSERSVGAARYARFLSMQVPCEITLLHVLTPIEYQLGASEMTGLMMADLYRNQHERLSLDLDRFRESELAGCNARSLIREGDPAAQVVELAHAEGVSLIVMPTHGYGPFRRFILGSNTAKVLHDADCPVWTGVHIVETASSGPLGLRNVLCAVDLSDYSAKTLAWASWIAASFGGRLTLMHTTAAIPDTGDRTEEAWRANLRWSAAQELERLKSAVGCQAEILLKAGDPAQSICAAAQETHADLLVIGRGSAAGGFGRLRTNAYAIIRQSPCPVVSV